MKIHRFFILTLVSLTLSSCFREESPLPEYIPSGEIRTATIPLSEFDDKLGAVTFTNQVFFQLSSGDQYTVRRDIWDLGFECSEDGYHIILNSANYMQIANAGTDDFSTTWTEADMKNYTFAFDSATGHLTHTAIGDWTEPGTGKNTHQVFLLDRGYDGSQEARGFKKILFEKLDGNTFHFTYANLDGTNEHAATITKDPDYNFVFFSLETHEQVQVQPPKTDWDICFSYYSYRYPDGVPYWLTGALTNRFQVRAAEFPDRDTPFENITLGDTSKISLSPYIDEIGFDWKEYLFGPPAQYVVYSDRSFLVKDIRGYFYKLRFTDFYNEEGERGFPEFEYQKL